MKSTDNQTIQDIVEAVHTASERDAVAGLCGQGLEKTPSKSMVLKALSGCNEDVVDMVCSLCEKKPDRTDILALIKALERIPVVRLTISFTPTDTAMSRWQQLLSDALKEQCILDITKDQTIAAGAEIEMKGRIFRYVLGDEIEKEIQKAK